MHSPSGAGKTSLIQAKLRGELVAKRFEVLPIIRLKLAEGEQLGVNANPYTLATLHCLGLSGPDPGDQTPSDAAETPNTEPDRKLERYLRRLLVEQNGCSKVLVFDQFEKILTLDPTDLDAKREFFRQLGTALTNLPLWVLFSMREEFVAALEPYTHLIPTHLTTTFRLPLLNGGGIFSLSRSRPAVRAWNSRMAPLTSWSRIFAEPGCSGLGNVSFAKWTDPTWNPCSSKSYANGSGNGSRPAKGRSPRTISNLAKGSSRVGSEATSTQHWPTTIRRHCLPSPRVRTPR